MILAVCANPSVDSFWSVNDIRKGTTNRSTRESFYPGGKGIHVAFALKELDQKVAILGVWGGQTGQWLKEQCFDRDIQPIGPHLKEWTRICITNKSETDWNETELLGSGPAVDEHEIRSFQIAFQQYLTENDIEAVTISGSVPRGFEEDLYQKLVELGQTTELPVFVDASGPLLKQALSAHPYAVHINRHEGKELCGSSDPVKTARWLSDYCTVAAVTAGADGLYLLSEGKLLHASCSIDPSKIHSTIGSGDCLLAGLCLATLTNDDPEEWARFATACGSANCIHSELGMLSAEDVTDLLDKVKVEIIHDGS